MSIHESNGEYNMPLCFVFLANALKCWRCTSDASGAAFCQDPFEPDVISEQQMRWSYVDCILPPLQQFPSATSANFRPVCKKLKQISELLRELKNNFQF